MKRSIVLGCLITCSLGSGHVWANMSPCEKNALTQQGTAVSLPRNQLEHLEQLANYGKTLKESLGEKVEMLSTGNQRLINLGEKWNKLKPTIEKILEKGLVPKALAPVNDVNSADDFISRFAGMTQSETTSAWCGANAIICFNDSGSIIRTLLCPPPSPSPSGSFSFVGWSRSTNPTATLATFTDKGVMIPDPNPECILIQDLLGDTKAVCASTDRFYCSSISTLYTRTMSGFVMQSAISVVRSLDGGNTFGSAVPAAQKPITGGYYDSVLDKPWMAVMPGTSSATDTIYVTYTSVGRYVSDTIEFVRSDDGGDTWSVPIVISSGEVQGSQVVFSPRPVPTIYVTWEEYALYPDSFPCSTRRIKIRNSVDNGATFSDPVTITDVVGCGDGRRMQGNFRNYFDNSGLAVNQTNGNVYMVYQDGKDKSVPDPFGECGNYNFSNIYFRRSTDGGATWTVPTKVNSDAATANVDQFMPGIAVEKKTGRIMVTFYDRRKDPRNFRIGFWRAISTDGGDTWTNQKPTSKDFGPITGWEDDLVADAYMSDYEAPTSDSEVKSSAGFIANWSDNTLGDANAQFLKIP